MSRPFPYPPQASSGGDPISSASNIPDSEPVRESRPRPYSISIIDMPRPRPRRDTSSPARTRPRPTSLFSKFRKSPGDHDDLALRRMDREKRVSRVPFPEPAKMEVTKEEDEIDWARIATLPRVCLIPPDEDELEPVTLYPIRPRQPPPPLLNLHNHLPFPLSPPTSLQPLPERPASPPLPMDFAFLSRQAGTPQHSQWGGMSPGFALPPPRFTRRSSVFGGQGGGGVIMPKKRSQVVADRERRLAREAIDGAYPPKWRDSVVEVEDDRAEKKVAMEEDKMPMEMIPLVHIDERRPPIVEEPAPRGESDLEAAQVSPVDDPISGPHEDSTDDVSPTISPEISEPETGPFTSAGKVKPESPANEGVASGKPPAATMRTPSRSWTDFPSFPTADTKPPPPVATADATSSASSSSSSAPAATHPPRRQKRALSLTSSLASSALPPKQSSPAPAVPALRPELRKQKSLKQFFFNDILHGNLEPIPPIPPMPSAPSVKKQSPNSHTPAPTNSTLIKGQSSQAGSSVDKDKDKEKRSRIGLLARPKSKPSLRIDVRSNKASDATAASAKSDMGSTVPALVSSSAGSTSEPESSVDTPASGSTPAPMKLTKRFSLSNMSAAFKKLSNAHNAASPPVPKVPDIRAKYKKEREAKDSMVPLHPGVPSPVAMASSSSASHSSPKTTTKRSAVGGVGMKRGLTDPLPSRVSEEVRLAPKRGESEHDLASGALEPALDINTTTSARSDFVFSARSKTQIETTASSDADAISIASLSSISSFEDASRARLMQVSPRTRRNPGASVSLQEFLGNAPMQEVEVIPGHRVRASVEATIILGDILPLGMDEPSLPPREGSLDSLSSSSDPSSEDHLSVPLTPSLPVEMTVPTPMGIDVEVLDRLDAIRATVPITAPLIIPFSSPPANIAPRLEVDSCESLAILSALRERHQVPAISVDVPETDMTLMAGKGAGALPSFASDLVIVDTPPPPPPARTPTSLASSKASGSTGKSWMASPEVVLRRLIISPRRRYQTLPPERHPDSQSRARERREEEGSAKTVSIPLPPIPDADDHTGPGYSAFAQGIQLKSLHFDSLGLDFGQWAEGKRAEVES